MSSDLLNQRSSSSSDQTEPDSDLQACDDDDDWMSSYTCLQTRSVCVLVMDWMQWSLVAPATGNAWPSVPQELSETLALTTALSYSLVTCETCMLNYFDSVSIHKD